MHGIVGDMINRRRLSVLVAITAATHLLSRARATPASSPITAYAFTFKGLDGGDILLSDFADHPILVINTASQCGYTPQFAGLQQLWSRYHDRGLMMIGVPSNDFGGQEPGGATEINNTAHGDYHVTFPLTEKTVVKGVHAHPFYRWAAQQAGFAVPHWNFHKYLIGHDGRLKASFDSAVEPTDPKIITAIEADLADA